MTCGKVNSKSSYGEFVGFQIFVSASNSKLTFLEEQVEDFNTVWNKYCEQ